MLELVEAVWDFVEEDVFDCVVLGVLDSDGQTVLVPVLVVELDGEGREVAVLEGEPVLDREAAFEAVGEAVAVEVEVPEDDEVEVTVLVELALGREERE